MQQLRGFFPWEGQNLRACDRDLVAHRKTSIQKAFLLSSLGKVSQVHETEENRGRHLCEMQLNQDRRDKGWASLDSSLSVLGKIIS